MKDNYSIVENENKFSKQGRDNLDLLRNKYSNIFSELKNLHEEGQIQEEAFRKLNNYFIDKYFREQAGVFVQEGLVKILGRLK